MKVTPYLEEVLFEGQTPAANQWFEEKSDEIFEPPERNSFVDLHTEWPMAEDTETLVGSTDSLSSASFHICRSTKQNGPPDDPSHYLGRPGLCLRKISDLEELRKVASDTQGSSRYCFIRQRHSYSRLQITRLLFEGLRSSFGISSKLNDFVLLFGIKQDETEVGVPQLHFGPTSRRETDFTCNRDDGFECIYALRYVERNHRNTRRPWSLRQMAIYHHFRSQDQSSTWVLLSASESAERYIERYIERCACLSGLNPFEIHVLLLEAATMNWRPYILSKSAELNSHADKILVASVDERDTLSSLDFDERQRLKDTEDELIDALLVLDCTQDTVTSLMERYTQYCHCAQNLNGNNGQTDIIHAALRQKSKQLLLFKKQIQALHDKLRGSTKLLANLLDLSNGSSLRQLEEETKEENLNMRRLAEKSHEDAAAVKVLTIITLIYLPASAVSNFFSSQFVDLDTEPKGSRVRLSTNWWIFAAISAPLTLLTVFVWWVWVHVQARMAQRAGKRMQPTPLTKILTHHRVLEKNETKAD